MRFAVIALLALTASPAKADLLKAVRTGVMCTSADALAKLALPDGSSRSAAADAPPSINAIAQAGGCIDFPAGNIVVVQAARKNTSIVRSDTLTGEGVLGTFIVPNIDYAPYAPPHDAFNDTIRARCPSKLEALAAETPPPSQFIASLPAPLRAEIDKAVDDACGSMGPCMTKQRIAEIGWRQLGQRWADFVCRAP